jgi:hypothetical protein
MLAAPHIYYVQHFEQVCTRARRPYGSIDDHDTPPFNSNSKILTLSSCACVCICLCTLILSTVRTSFARTFRISVLILHLLCCVCACFDRQRRTCPLWLLVENYKRQAKLARSKVNANCHLRFPLPSSPLQFRPVQIEAMTDERTTHSLTPSSVIVSSI